MILQNVNDIPSDWEVFNVRKKTPVSIRQCNGVERFKVTWSDSQLFSDPTKDIIVISEEGMEYPCKIDIFADTYEKVGNNSYVKKYVYRVVKIPKNITLSVVTLEGQVDGVSYPDFIAIGPRNELYVNTKEFFEQNLEIM